MPKDGGTWEKSFFDRAIQSSIGRALRTHYDVPQELPDDLSDLLRRVDEKSGGRSAPDDEKKGAGASSVH
jgi:hypothetical protein